MPSGLRCLSLPARLRRATLVERVAPIVVLVGLLVFAISSAWPASSTLNVTLDLPAQGAKIGPPLPATVSLQATVSNGTATKVQFFEGLTPIATVTGSGPVYRATWSNVGDGAYGITAVATDASGNSVSSTQSIVTVTQSSVAPPAKFVANFDTGDWTQLEIGGATDGIAQNWPYGYLFDGGRFGGVGGPGITMVDQSQDPTHVRLGSHGTKLTLRQGASAAYGQDQDGRIDALWIVPGIDNPEPVYRSTSNYKPGQSRAAQLPTDADIAGREVYWGVSFYYDPASSFDGAYYAGGPNFHSGAACGDQSFTGLRVVSGKFILTVRGSNTPGSCSPWLQTDYAFNDDGSFLKSCTHVGSSCTDFPSAADQSAWKPITKGIWYDFVFHFVWSDDSKGKVELWVQKNKSGVYKLVVPLSAGPTLYSYGGSARTSSEIAPYFGIYRPRGIANDMTMWIDEIRRGATFNDAMIPGSRLEGYGSAPTSTQPSAPSNTTPPAISGDAAEQQTLTATAGSWTPSPTGYTYQWQRCDSAGQACSAIAGETKQSYVVQKADVGSTLRVAVTATSSGAAGNATSDPTDVVRAANANLDSIGAANTVGRASVGAYSTSVGGGFLDASGPYTVPAAGTVGKLTGYVRGGDLASKLRAVVYADDNGAPGALVAASKEVVVAAGAAPAWVDFPFASAVSLGQGKYWLGYWSADGQAREYYDSVDGSERFVPAAYSSTGSAPATYGSSRSSMSAYSLYASVNVVQASDPTPSNGDAVKPSSDQTADQQPDAPVQGDPVTTSLGRTSVGSSSAGGGSGYIAVSGSYTLAAPAKLSKLTGYMVGGTYDQRMRAVVYADNGGRPGAFVAASSEITVPKGAPAAWVNFPVAGTPSLAAGKYWLGYWFGGTTVREYFDDVAGSGRYIVANYSTTGAPPASFGTGNASTAAFSLYATVTSEAPASPPATTTTPTTTTTTTTTTTPAPPPAPTSGTFGRTSVGASAAKGGSNFVDASGPYDVSNAVSVDKLTGYVRGGTLSSPLRAAIYADNGGEPGALVAVTKEVTVAAGAAPGWVTFAFSSPVSLASGKYWLGYWYGTGDAQEYYDKVDGSERFAPATYSSTGQPPSSLGGARSSSSGYSLYASWTSK